MLKNNQTFFISDLHLDPMQPQITQLFLDFLTYQAPQADALYILGDLFEVWIGDDNNNTFIQTIKSNLKNLTAKNIPVYIMPGNRDFLLGKRFAKETGCQILKDPTKIDLYGVATLLMHGDSLCTTDIRHQWFRRFSQNSLVKKLFLILPLTFRKRIANNLRHTSKKRTSNMSIDIMDVTANAVQHVMQHYQVSQLIHGHTHQPKVHSFLLNGHSAKRIVLGAWHTEGSVLVCGNDISAKLHVFSLSNSKQAELSVM